MAEELLPLFPEAGMKPAVIEFLRTLPIPPETRKWTLLEWCRHTGAILLVEDVKAVTRSSAG